MSLPARHLHPASEPEPRGDVTWRIEIERSGMWPFRWDWQTWRINERPYSTDLRIGCALTKDRARRKALAAKRSMEDDDVTVTWKT